MAMNVLSKKESYSSLSDIDNRIAFLNYTSDMLKHSTKTSEGLKLRQVAYFLSMATIEAMDELAKLEIQRELQLAIERAGKVT
jgi:hypothetical protein